MKERDGLILQHLIAWRGSVTTLIFILNPFLYNPYPYNPYFNNGIHFFSLQII